MTGDWKYNDLLNVCLTVLLVVGTGFLSSWAKILHTRQHLAAINAFVFKFSLPALVAQGLGLGTNFYREEIWRFIGTFLLLRALSLAAVTLWALGTRGTLGQAMVNWLAATWISTVILGVPVISAALGPQYANLGILAGISSFLFQLPLMLAGLEADRYLREEAAQEQKMAAEKQGRQEGVLAVNGKPADGRSPVAGHPMISPRASARDGGAIDLEAGPMEGAGAGGEPASAPGSTPPEAPCCCVAHSCIGDADGGSEVGRPAADGAAPDCAPQHLPPCGNGGGGGGASNCVPSSKSSFTGGAAASRDWGPARGRRRRAACAKAAANIGRRMLHNHVLWGIAVGFLLSLTTVGYKYLYPGTPQQPNSRFVEPTGFIAETLSWLGRCTQPLALFATGMFCHQWITSSMRQWHGMRAAVAWLAKICAYMVVKLVMIPALAVGCAQVTGLEGAQGRAAVLIGALPISLAAFAVGQEFGVGQQELAANVVIGTLLLLPTAIAWSSFMDAVGLYTVP